MLRFEGLQDAKLPKGVMVDLKQLAAIADAHAFEVWGEAIACGEPFPVLDAAGEIRAYVFPYAIGVRAFPDKLLSDNQQPEADGQFGAIYVAARPTRYPVLRVVHALPPLFRHGVQAEERGRNSLAASDARLTRVYWLGLHKEYFEVAAGERHVLLDAYTLEDVEPSREFEPPLDLGDEEAAE